MRARGRPARTPRRSTSGDAGDGGRVWLERQAESSGLNRFAADSWSAPAGTKTNSLVNGGAVCGRQGASCSSGNWPGNWTEAYANYLVQDAKFATTATNAAYHASIVPATSVSTAPTVVRSRKPAPV